MDDFLDRAWEQIETFLDLIVLFLDNLFSPLEILGPGFVILIISCLVVGITRFISRFYETKRFIRLKKEFKHWHGIREEALNHPVPDKGKLLAKNIDQGKLNQVYYDYFFEGLLKNFITNVLPLLLGASYVTTVYSPGTLLTRFGRNWVFSFSATGSNQVNVSSLLWYVVCVLFWFISFFILKTILKKRQNTNEPAPTKS